MLGALGLRMLLIPRCSKLLLCGATALAAASSTPAVRAGSDGQAEPARSPSQRCTAWEIDYSLHGELRLSDTPLEAGNGTYAIGPGDITLRFENHQGKPGGKVELLSYRMRERYSVRMRALFTNTVLHMRAETRIPRDPCRAAAQGSLDGPTVHWLSAVTGYRTTGTVTCTGFLCGKPGVPPAGSSELGIEASSVAFEDFSLGKNLATLTMPFGFVASVRKPKQTMHLALHGRELRRRCVTPPECG